MFHHLLVPLYEGTYVTSKIRIHNISMLDIQILKVVQDKGGNKTPACVSFEGATEGCVLMAQLVALTVLIMVNL